MLVYTNNSPSIGLIAVRDKYNTTNYSLNYFLALTLRWGHPGQQQGRFLPFFKSSCSRSRCSCLVSFFFTIVTQQIHSLRASGVRFSQRAWTSLCLFKTNCRSLGIRCLKSVFAFIVAINFIITKPARNIVSRASSKIHRQKFRSLIWVIFITFRISLYWGLSVGLASWCSHQEVRSGVD